MNDVFWPRAPKEAEAWAPETAKYMAGWYKTDSAGNWFFSTSNRVSGAEWWTIEAPTKYRQRQMERRP